MGGEDCRKRTQVPRTKIRKNMLTLSDGPRANDRNGTRQKSWPIIFAPALADELLDNRAGRSARRKAMYV